jgi:hypothetical protein
LNRFSWTEIELNTYEQEEKRERDALSILMNAKAKCIIQTLEAINLIKSGESDVSISKKLELALDLRKALRKKITV